MRKLFSLVVLFLCSIVANAQIIIEPEVSEIAKMLLHDDEGKYDYYVGQTYNVPDSPSHSSSKGYWFVLVDLEPGSGWEHPCKYVYIPKQSLGFAPNYRIVDSTRPPSNITLRPAFKPNRYGDNATMKPCVPKIQTRSLNNAAGNTYAVILNGGMSVTANSEKYWNDCSFIYQTLRNTYGVPKQNIKVIMSDGTNSGVDMNKISGGYVSSPLDLDFDGESDIEYAATKANLRSVLNDMAGKLTDKDHLLLFVTDHGGYSNARKSSFLYLWNSVELYPDELASYLEPIDAGFISIVMGQCYSGGFIDALAKPNRIIATACAKNEMSFASNTIPFNEFLYHWTSALNGYDAFNNAVDCRKNISIMDAQLYAARHDHYANGGTEHASETPQINYFTYSVASELSLSNIPPTVDLIFDDYTKPLESELITKSYDSSDVSNYPNTLKYNQSFKDYENLNEYYFWNNPYIWLRNGEDGETVQESEKLIIEKHKPVFVYFKVRNRGVKDYTKGDQIVKAYWAKSDIVINREGWKGMVDVDNPNRKYTGGTLGECDLDYIPAGKSSINSLWYTFNSTDLKTALEPGFNMCVLAYIRDAYELGTMPVDEDRIVEVWKTEKLGQSNLSFTQTMSYTELTHNTYVDISNLCLIQRDYSLKIMKNNSIKPLFSEAKISMKLSSDLLTSWDRGGQMCEDIETDKNESDVFLVKSDTSKFNSLKMDPYQTGKIELTYNFFANEAITKKKKYDIDVALVDNATGKCLGGETFRIVQEPRPAINPYITTMTQSNGRMLLEATNVNEDAVYRWYDSNGILVGTGQTFTVPAGSASNYTVRAEAKSDGAISDSQPVLAESSSIKSVDSRSNPTAVNVEFYAPIATGATLRLASSDGHSPAMSYKVENGATSYDIPASGLSSGVYQVTLVEEGTVTGVKKFAK